MNAPIAARRNGSMTPAACPEIFSGGINAFARYKNGKTKLPLAW